MNAPCSSFSVWSCRQSKVPFMMDARGWGVSFGQERGVGKGAAAGWLSEERRKKVGELAPLKGRTGERRCLPARRAELFQVSNGLLRKSAPSYPPSSCSSPSRELSHRLASIYGKAKVPRSSCEEHGRAHSPARGGRGKLSHAWGRGGPNKDSKKKNAAAARSPGSKNCAPVSVPGWGFFFNF